MSATCSACEVRIFDDEIPAGLCEFCQIKTRRANPRQGTSEPAAARLEGFGVARAGVRLGVWVLFALIALVLLVMASIAFPALLMGCYALAPVASLLSILAAGMCCVVPASSGLRARAALAGVTMAAAAAVNGVLLVSGVGQYEQGSAAQLLGTLLNLASGVSFYVLLGGIASAHGDRTLASRLYYYPVFCVGLAVMAISGTSAIANAAGAGRDGAMMAMVLAVVLAAVVMFGYAASLLTRLSRAMGA
jgi:hypothetical protein